MKKEICHIHNRHFTIFDLTSRREMCGPGQASLLFDVFFLLLLLLLLLLLGYIHRIQKNEQNSLASCSWAKYIKLWKVYLRQNLHLPCFRQPERDLIHSTRARFHLGFPHQISLYLQESLPNHIYLSTPQRFPDYEINT